MRDADFSAHSPGRLVPTIEGARAFVPNPALRRLDLDTATTSVYGEAERALGHLRGATQRLVLPYLVWSPLLHREAILSGKIEGTITTPEQLVLLEAASKGSVANPPEPNRDTQEVLNYVKAMHYGLRKLNDLPVCLRLLRGIHDQQ